jgi:hypothetical protein
MKFLNSLFRLFSIIFIACLGATFVYPLLAEHRMRVLSVPFGLGFLYHALECHITKKVCIGRSLDVSERGRLLFIIGYSLVGISLMVFGGLFWWEVLTK